MVVNRLPLWHLPDEFERVVAIGDIHGDLDALLRILIGMALINPEGDWIAPQTCLVLLGDLNDRGPDSIPVLDAAMQLERLARANDAVVYALLGNHEMLVAEGNFSFFSPVEARAAESFRYQGRTGLSAIYQGDSLYARWLRQRPALLKIGRTVFAHGGLGDGCLHYTPDVINQTLQDWMAYFQGMGEAPDQSTAWLTEQNSHSPIWTRCLRVGRQSASESSATRSMLHKLGQAWGFERIVAGHNPTLHLEYRAACPHPVFGDAVAVIDTGICRFYSGHLSALELRFGTPVMHYFERGEQELTLTKKWRAQCRQRLQSLSQTAA